MNTIILILAALMFVFGLFSRLSNRMPVTGPMIFVAAGIILGPLGLNLIQPKMDSETVQTIAELTLILVLFIGASSIDLRSLKGDYKIPLRLLLIGLPITMVLGILLAIPLFGSIGIWSVALMALILSPTDAALGQVVVDSPAVPEKIRDSIAVESGLNDGIALPPIMACMAVLAVVSSGKAQPGGEYWMLYTVKQIAFGPVAGAFIGWVGGKLIERASRRRWMDLVLQRLSSITLAVLCYAFAQWLGGNGFIAAFFGGLFLGTHTPSIRERIQNFGEAEGHYLMLFVFLFFGLVMVPIAKNYWDVNAFVYAILSLTVIRMVPVAICLIGSKLDLASVAFIGWFGPRGIASVLYTLMVVGQLGFKGYEKVLSVIVLTVLISVFLHGVSAVPLAALYGKSEDNKV